MTAAAARPWQDALLGAVVMAPRELRRARAEAVTLHEVALANCVRFFGGAHPTTFTGGSGR